MGTDEIVDLTAYGYGFTADPYPVYAELRARGPVHRVGTRDAGEVWLIVGYEEARAALADPRFSKDWRNSLGWDEDFIAAPINSNMLEADPPLHTRLRKLVTREFTARRVAALRPRVQEIADGLLDELLASPARRGDLVDALAFPLPMTVICELLGVPELDREAFRRWSNEIVAPTAAETEQEAVREMSAYLAGLVADLRRAQPGDDLLSALIHSTAEDGDRLSEQELVGMAFLLLVAGHETTVNLISNAVRALLLHPPQLAALRADLGLLPAAVEETLRYEGPVEAATFRFTAEQVEFGGAVIPAHSPVLVALAAAGRDPGRFAAPDGFDISRDTRGHLGFGHGVHYCLGAPLARLEGQIAIGSLLRRCPGLALDADPEELEWIPGLLMRGVRRLPVRW